jgi:hypothetical protein
MFLANPVSVAFVLRPTDTQKGRQTRGQNQAKILGALIDTRGSFSTVGLQYLAMTMTMASRMTKKGLLLPLVQHLLLGKVVA